MKNRKNITCQLISDRKWTWKYEISEVFQVFSYDTFTEIKNTENRKIFSRLVNSKTFILFEEIESFWDFPVFNFGPCTEIKNSENLKIFSRHVNSKGLALFEEDGNFWGLRVFDFHPYTEIENLENSKKFCKFCKF